MCDTFMLQAMDAEAVQPCKRLRSKTWPAIIIQNCAVGFVGVSGLPSLRRIGPSGRVPQARRTFPWCLGCSAAGHV